MEKFWKNFSSNQKNIRIQIDIKRFDLIVERRLETHSGLELKISIGNCRDKTKTFLLFFFCTRFVIFFLLKIGITFYKQYVIEKCNFYLGRL